MPGRRSPTRRVDLTFGQNADDILVFLHGKDPGLLEMFAGHPFEMPSCIHGEFEFRVIELADRDKGAGVRNQDHGTTGGDRQAEAALD